jgi:Domain of Unknown Function (DUF1080)
MRIVAKGSQITVFLNDVQVVDADLSDYRDQFGQKPWLNRPRGHLGLQSWDGKIEFRKLHDREAYPHSVVSVSQTIEVSPRPHLQ